MSELLQEAEQKAGRKSPSPERVFLEFKYPEVKELLKHFLTLISASLVFSITFSDKVIDYSTADGEMRNMVIGAWILLVLALGFCGIGIYTLYLAAQRAIDSLVLGQIGNFRALARSSYLFQDLSGLCFGVALVLLVVSAMLR